MRPAIAAILGALACACVGHAAHADWLYAKWGMTPEQVAAASRGTVTVIPKAKRTQLTDLKMEHGAEGTYTDGKLTLRVNFSFDTSGGGLAMVGYGAMDPAQNTMLQDWMAQKFGPPQSTGGLPAIGMQTFHWRGTDEIDLTISTGDSAFVLQSQAERK